MITRVTKYILLYYYWVVHTINNIKYIISYTENSRPGITNLTYQ